MSEQARFATPPAGPRVPDPRGHMGELDRTHERITVADGDQRRHDAGSRLSQALALGARYSGDTAVQLAGAGGALILTLAYAIGRNVGS